MNTLQAQTAYIGSTEIKQVRLGNELVLAPNGDALWYKANELPSLDLRFADNKSLVDATTGTNLIDFTRASSGTYVGSDGLIKTATTNLLLRSEEFDDVAWSTASLTITADDATAPDGTETADKWLNTSTTGIISNSISKAASAVTYTASLWVKSSDATSFSLTIDNGGTGDRGRCVFNITTGALVSAIDDGAFTGTSGTITAYPDSWYRLTVTTTTDTGTTLRWRAFSSGTGDIIYLWGAQLEQSSTVGEYIPTTSTINSAPRFDHDPVTGESLGLLVEESRTNLLLQSEDFSTTWSASDASVLINQTTAPDGTTTADKLICGTGTPTFQGISQAFTATTAATRFSAYIKAGELNQVELRTFSPTEFAIFDLSDGTVVATSGDPDASIVDAGNGWYRCSISAPDTGVTSARISLADGGSRTFTPVTDAGVYIWGAQLEEGPFPTSYIPTEGSAVTRAADVASITGTNFSSWYRQDEGTVFAEFQTANATGLPTGFNTRVFQVSDGTVDNRYDLFVATAGNLNAFMNILSVGQLTGVQLAGLVANNSVVSGCLSYKTNDVIVAGNGILSSADNSCSIPTTSRLNIGSRGDGGVGALHGHIRRLVYWDQRLPNEVLQTITQ